MAMRVTVRAGRHRLVHVTMVTIVVVVGMLMFERLVRVRVTMRLGQMDKHSAEHEQPTGGHQPAW